MTATALETFAQIQEHAAAHADDTLKVVESLQPGEHVAQGDVTLICLPALPPGATEATTVAQLAPGTTRGSRHCIAQQDLHKVKSCRLGGATELHGPVLVASERFLVEHPEHADYSLPPGIYAVTYQRMFAAELRRMAD